MSAAPKPIDAHTECYGVLGFPVRHSRSPAIFNAAFQASGRNAVYLAFEQEHTARAVEAMRSLGLRGLSVTIPHKENAMKCVDECDESARRVGCLNTIINRDGRLVGYNFDGDGAISPLDSFFPGWKEKKIVFIGAGGSARGIALAMASAYGAKQISFLVRSPEKAQPLLRELETLGVACRALSMNEKSVDADLLINTTPIGMHPKTDATPCPASFFQKNMHVYDIVYNPVETRFLREAASAGLPVLGGAAMFLGQAALQYRLWTGEEAPRAVMADAFHKAAR